VANGGTLVTPYLVDQITDDAGNIIYQHEVEVKRQVVSEEICKTISEILEDGVSGNGCAKNAYVAGYRVAAKTGTSEKKDAGKEGLYICSAVAYAPADNPEIAIIIMVDEPSGSSPYGSTVAAPYVGATLKNVLKHHGVEQIFTEAEQKKMMVTVGSYRRWTPEKAKATIESRGLVCEIVGEGELVTSQYPPSETEILKETGKVILCLGDATPSTVKVPNLIGMSAETANQYLNYYGLNVTVVGPMNATVYAQSIAPDTEVPIGTSVELTFRSMEGDEDPNYDRVQ
jgi:stage V sporulation protein D (sporulation-specific penicillin-binding protein)